MRKGSKREECYLTGWKVRTAQNSQGTKTIQHGGSNEWETQNTRPAWGRTLINPEGHRLDTWNLS